MNDLNVVARALTQMLVSLSCIALLLRDYSSDTEAMNFKGSDIEIRLLILFKSNRIWKTNSNVYWIDVNVL